MTNMRTRPFETIVTIALVIVCLAACVLFMYLPYRALETGLVYTGF